MGVLVVLLLGEGLLDTSEVEELCGELEGHREIFLEVLSVVLKALSVSVLELNDFALVLLLGSL